jgi:hypothetical protein
MSAPHPSSWAPVPLADILSGDYIAPEPSILARTDARFLIYPGRIHAINAEPEALKSWLALQACAERLSAGECVLYIDFEENAPAIVHRLLLLGVEPNAIREGLSTCDRTNR